MFLGFIDLLVFIFCGLALVVTVWEVTKPNPFH